MLDNLAPQSPATINPPLNGLPTPHLLIGYAYLFNVNNNYHFSSRTYTRLRYDSQIGQMQRTRNFWSILSDCAYVLDTSQIPQLTGPNFEENFLPIQREILANRILADMQAREDLSLQGSGITLQPEATENIKLQEELNEKHIKTLRQYLNGHDFHTKQIFMYEIDKDRAIITEINNIIKILTNFIYDWHYNTNKEYIPYHENWLKKMSETYKHWRTNINDNYINAFRLASNATKLPYSLWKGELYGGARLRSGTTTGLPFRLRQRQNARAITESIRRNRGQIVQNFIDSLPLIRRIRRPVRIPPEEEDAGEGPSGLQEELELGNEILRILHIAINELRNELSGPAREHEMFNFGTEFYNLLERAINENRVTNDYIIRFFFYFFIMEHITSTLFYYNALLNLNVPFRRYVHFNYIQVIVTGRDIHGQVNLHRIWHNNNISPFLRIYRTILRDLLTICDRASETLETALDEENLLAALHHRPQSGDPNDLLQQARLRESEVHTVQINFKLNPTGLVTTATNRQIIVNASQVRTQEMRRLRAPR